MSVPEGNPMFALLLGQSQFLGPSETLEGSLEPMPEQYDIKPGDKCLAATANTMLEEDFTILEVLEPDSHLELFPDWEERAGVGESHFGLGSHVLAQWFSVDFPEGDLGWFSRVKLIKITEENFAQASSWRDGSWEDPPPQWIEDAFTRYTDALAVQAPDTIPLLAVCGNPECGKREVELHVTGRKTFIARAGSLQQDGKTIYVPLAEPDDDLRWAAHLVCKDCGAVATLEDGEWHLPPG